MQCWSVGEGLQGYGSGLQCVKLRLSEIRPKGLRMDH